jgi:hypothetical protein
MFGTSNMYFRKKKPNSATPTARAVTMRRIANRRDIVIAFGAVIMRRVLPACSRARAWR